MEPESAHSKSLVQVTRNVARVRKSASVNQDQEVPIMEVFKKIERMTSRQDEEDLPDTLRMTMENPDISNEPIDFHCEAVKKDDGSVQYECRFVQNDQPGMPKTRVSTGKFSLNLP